MWDWGLSGTMVSVRWCAVVSKRHRHALPAFPSCLSLYLHSNEPGPDFADYPYDTVPNKVDQLFRAQRHHDRRQNDVRTEKPSRKMSI